MIRRAGSLKYLHGVPKWFFTELSGKLRDFIKFDACLGKAKPSLLGCRRVIAAGQRSAVFRLKLGTTNTRAEVRSTAFKRNHAKW